jgi:hypothetical protein
MKRAYVRTSGILAAGLVSVLFFGNSAFAQLVSRERILDALMIQPAPPSLPSRPILTRSMTLNDHDDYVLASTRPTAAVDLEVYFDFNSAAITVDALPQLHELGAALADPRLKGPQSKTVAASCRGDQAVSYGRLQAAGRKTPRRRLWKTAAEEHGGLIRPREPAG